MTYMQDLEQQLHDRLLSFADGDLSAHDFIAFVKKTVLDSYHNGQAAGPKPAPQSNGQPAQAARPDARPQWRNKKPSAAGAQFSRNYQS
jgi:hypothetical protein